MKKNRSFFHSYYFNISFETSLLCHNMIVAVVLFLDQSENEESFG